MGEQISRVGGCAGGLGERRIACTSHHTRHYSIPNTLQVFQGFTAKVKAGNAETTGVDGTESSESWENALQWRN